MSLQIITSIEGKEEYVLLPIGIYRALHSEIEAKLKKTENRNDRVIQPENRNGSLPVFLSCTSRQTKDKLVQ